MKITKLDKVFSEFIRLRDADENGIVKCVTCGTLNHWRKMDNGHFIKRQHMSLRFNEINCNVQCKKCNWLGQGEDVKYAEYLRKKHGEDVIIKLQRSKNQTVKYAQFDIDYFIEYYTKKVKQMKSKYI